MRVVLRCKHCGGPAAVMDAPTGRELRQMLGSGPFASLAAFIPPQAAQELASKPIYECMTCAAKEVANASEEKAPHEEEADEHEPTVSDVLDVATRRLRGVRRVIRREQRER